MDEIRNYVARVAQYFASELGEALVEVYELGSLAHGGFSLAYSDLDVGVIIKSSDPPEKMERMISGAKQLDPAFGARLSVFWGSPDREWGRLPVLDRLDLLDHGVPLLYNTRALFPRPTKEDIHHALLESVERNWKPKTAELCRLTQLQPHDRKPYIRSLLYSARLIYSWDRLEAHSNDRAVDYLRKIKPPGLDLRPIELALACRHDRCRPEEIFAQKVDLRNQLEKTISFISDGSSRDGGQR